MAPTLDFGVETGLGSKPAAQQKTGPSGQNSGEDLLDVIDGTVEHFLRTPFPGGFS